MPKFNYLFDNAILNFMMNQFNLSDWYDNDESDLYEFIDLIKDYYDEMTDRLRR